VEKWRTLFKLGIHRVRSRVFRYNARKFCGKGDKGTLEREKQVKMYLTLMTSGGDAIEEIWAKYAEKYPPVVSTMK
jgi:hypothetical protein